MVGKLVVKIEDSIKQSGGVSLSSGLEQSGCGSVLVYFRHKPPSASLGLVDSDHPLCIPATSFRASPPLLSAVHGFEGEHFLTALLRGVRCFNLPSFILFSGKSL